MKSRGDTEQVVYEDKRGCFRYLVKNSDTENIYELGEEEAFLCSMVDNGSLPEEIIEVFGKRFGRSICRQQLAAFVQKAERIGLLDGKQERTDRDGELDDNGHLLFNPDLLLRMLEILLRDCRTLPWRFLLVVVTMISLGIAVRDSGQYLNELEIILFQGGGPGSLICIPLLGLFVVTPLAEIVKGVACRYYGGQVSAFRIGFIFKIFPRFYADIWDALWVIEAPKRTYVFALGIVTHLLLWDLGILLWKGTLPWTGLHAFSNLFVSASFLFFLMNSIPLLRRDGYFLLSSRLEIDDLYERAMLFIESRVWGQPLQEPLTTRQQRIFMLYGLCCIVFNTVIAGLFVVYGGNALCNAFQGIGALMFLFLCYLVFKDVVGRQLRWIRMPEPRGVWASEQGAVRIRTVVKSGSLLVLALVMFIPYPFEVGGEFSILPAGQQGIRAEVAGTIDEVFITENQPVSKGKPVARLDDLVYRNKIDIIQASINETQALIELRVAGAKPEEIAVAEQQVVVARKSLEYSVREEARYAKMLNEKAIPETEYQFVKHKRDLDRETLKSAEKNLEVVRSGARDYEIQAMEARRQRLEVELVQAQADLEHTTLYSPINGVIITPALSQRVGQRLENGDLLAVVEDDERVLAEIEISESDIEEITEGALVKLRIWANPLQTLDGKIVAIAPVAYEKSRQGITRTLTEREKLIGQRELLRREGRVVRVVAEFTEDVDGLKAEMTGYAKIQCSSRPVGVAFSRWLMRLIFVEVWSWIP